MGKTKKGEQLVKAVHNPAGPLTLHKQSVMVKLTAPTTESKDTAELDFVAVLDTSASMKYGGRLENMQKAMMFVIDKLGKEDKLAIVNFDSIAHTNGYTVPVKLKGEGKEEKEELERAKKVVRELQAKGHTNIGDGLRKGIELLSNRIRADGSRAACIFLMSDGEENRGDAQKVLADQMTDNHNWTVHTFGFGEKHDTALLWAIAQKSHAGVYHHVLDNEDLSKAFAPTLGQYRSISMLDVTVTLTRKDANATMSVNAGDYRVVDEGETWTIRFGDLAREENRRIMIDVQLPRVTKNEKAPKPVLEVRYSYTLPVNTKNPGKTTVEEPTPVVVAIARDENEKSPVDKYRPEVEREIARLKLVGHIEEVKKLAEQKPPNMAGAISELEAAKKKLYALGNKDPKPKGEFLMDALFAEVDNIRVFLKNEADYAKLGRAYLNACLLSHGRQRYTARGGEDEVPLFLTERMKKYQRQAADFTF